jgi:prepilin-type N-terminal cleavage/methylation domain-containing protein
MKKIFIPKRGFTMIELVISLFIFTLISTATAGIFSRFFSTYTKTRSIQRNLEQSQQVLNSISKVIRTSSIVFPVADGAASNIVIYDYSQQKCIRYRFYTSGETHQLRTASEAVAARTDCDNNAVTNNINNMDIVADYADSINFEVVRSRSGSPGTVGKVTIAAGICQKSSDCAKDEIWIESSVSLRDYSESGLF